MTLDFAIPPITDELPIELRCYATPRWVRWCRFSGQGAKLIPT